MIKSIFCFKSKTENNKGQVAIFVALIFQIVFILFALLINVGLLIHHKINLQQSTDLAAYYGAMKQAEMLNVIGHVNFQTRQAFKLLTWRYRILGTFGFDKVTDDTSPITFPISRNSTAPFYQYNQDSDTFECNGPDRNGVNVTVKPNTLPFMCLNHYGFKDYPANSMGVSNTNNETFCRMNCTSLLTAEFTSIDKLKEPDNTFASQSASTISSIRSAIVAANKEIQDGCEKASPVTMTNLAKFYLSYFEDVNNKMQFMKMLFANLSADEKDMLDIEGNSIFKGTENTFINNLTEANNSSEGKDDNIFETFNSLSPKNGGECTYNGASSNWKKASEAPTKLFNELNFLFIQYFILKCEFKASKSQYSLSTIFDKNNSAKLDTTIFTQLKNATSQTTAENIEKYMTQQLHTVGIEKNPWCPVYYGVKSSSTPVIPFLPISKIKLNAISFAKPFGGSLGPKIYDKWNSNENKSNGIGGGLTLKRSDPMLPELNPTIVKANFDELKEQGNTTLNFSRFVGDSKGLSDARYIAVYHDILRNRTVAGGTETQLTPTSNLKNTEPKKGKNEPPDIWPAYSNWDKISEIIESPDYDPLALDNLTSAPRNSFMRDIELSVVAPNQFDVTYYSIEPDFYNVYVKGKLGEREVMDKLRSQAGLSGSKPLVPRDFGHTAKKIDGIPPVFSVRNQLEIVQQIFQNGGNSAIPSPTNYGFSGVHSNNMNQLSSFYFSDVPYLQGSLLTGWTFQDFVSDDYSKIPNDGETKTPFAVCADQAGLQGSNGYGSIAEQVNPTGAGEKLPPAPGNCITGGRVGYSVKIISPKSLSESVELGGESTSGQILNPPDSFISF